MSYQDDEQRFRQDLRATEVDARFIKNRQSLADYCEQLPEGVIDVLQGRRPLLGIVTPPGRPIRLEELAERIAVVRQRLADLMDGAAFNATDAEVAEWAVQKLISEGKLSS